MSIARARSILRRSDSAVRLVCISCFCFFAGMIFQTRRIHSEQVEAASNHLYELMVYHALPGKAPALESIFQNVSKLQAKHGLNTLGYLVPTDDSPAWKDTFVYLVVHSDRQSAETNWTALHADPAFHSYREAAAPLIQQKDGDYRVDEIYMGPTDYSSAR